jgi:hypothetical protein
MPDGRSASNACQLIMDQPVTKAQTLSLQALCTDAGPVSETDNMADIGYAENVGGTMGKSCARYAGLSVRLPDLAHYTADRFRQFLRDLMPTERSDMARALQSTADIAFVRYRLVLLDGSVPCQMQGIQCRLHIDTSEAQLLGPVALAEILALFLAGLSDQHTASRVLIVDTEHPDTPVHQSKWRLHPWQILNNCTEACQAPTC